MRLSLSKHANERLSGRMAGIVTRNEVIAAIYEAGDMGVGETAVIFKRLPKTISMRDCDGSVSTGNMVLAVFRRSSPSDAGCVTTVELRESWQKPSRRWARVIDLT